MKNKTVWIVFILVVVIIGGVYFVLQPQPSPKPDITFNASALQIQTGQPSTLSWHVTNARQCLLQNSLTPETDKVPFDGEKTVSPGQTMSFTLWCDHDLGNGKGSAAQKTITISVQ